MSRSYIAIALALLTLKAVFTSTCLAAEPSSAQQVLDQSAAQQKYTFLLFYKDDNQATRTMAQSLQTGLAQRSGEASICYVSTSDRAEQAIVKRFGVARAPLPFTLAVAPAAYSRSTVSKLGPPPGTAI